ncbi:RNA methyltransferase [Corynebacterium poyangense]|uniref:RNA methyltransferase n=1 Tax=Corynebacterium poyangense TaxID=2684405 RepID=A0A7H0SS92_9CORY|nr:RNA methyltransferase [Corynebacterium poyangense]QNQ91417.1 RNA methyltransferase [Corynebacterium poyangense]
MTELDFSAPFSDKTPRVVHAAKLKRSSGRKKAQRFLVEGENSVEAALATGAATDIFLSESAAQRFQELLHLAQYSNVYCHPISAKAVQLLSDTKSSTGIFAVCTPVLWRFRQCLDGSPRLISIPVETREPGNAGTLIRVSDAMGADAVVFAGDTCDPLSSKVARSSAGSLFHIPVSRHRDIDETISYIQGKGIQVLATAADGDISLDNAGEILSQPTAWLFGNEAHGLSPQIQELADHRVRIPIRGRAESLNLATAAAICLYESARAQQEEFPTQR